MKTLKLLIVKHWLVVDGGGGDIDIVTLLLTTREHLTFSSSHNLCAVLTTMQVKNKIKCEGKNKSWRAVHM